MGLDNPIHLAFLLLLLLLLFGARRLPEMGRSLGSGMRGFKDALGGQAPEDPAAGDRGPALLAHAQPPASAAHPEADVPAPERLSA